MSRLWIGCVLVCGLCAFGCSDDKQSTADAGQSGGGDAAAASDGAVADAAADGGGSSAGVKKPTKLPQHKNPCPTLKEGDVMFSGRKVRVWLGTDGKSKLGPLVFYWHGTGSNPGEVMYGLGQAAVDEIKSMGGMVAAIYSTTNCTGKTTGNNVWCYEDFDIADEILACAVENVGIDTSHIHTAGMSAGGLQSTAMSYSRSNYLASAVIYSGGLDGLITVTQQDPDNKLAAMIVHGGPKDFFTISFQMASESYQIDFERKGHFTFMCDHGMMHTIPSGIGASAWLFMKDHPYEVTPEPYKMALPKSFPSYCKL